MNRYVLAALLAAWLTSANASQFAPDFGHDEVGGGGATSEELHQPPNRKEQS